MKMANKFHIFPYLYVCHAVVVEVGAGSEAFTTHLALVWFFPAVDAPVCIERTGCGEPLTAHQTYVRLLT